MESLYTRMHERQNVVELVATEVLRDNAELMCQVRSLAFHCEYRLPLTWTELQSFVDNLSKLYANLEGRAVLQSRAFDVGSFLAFEAGKYGEIFVSGELDESSDNKLAFQFVTDQTALPSLIAQVRAILAAWDG